MTTILWTVGIASLLGSMHCVGMCGPLALWASGCNGECQHRSVVLATGLYHTGRLALYALVGLAAGQLGSLLELGGQTLGWQLLTARIAGVVMIAVGIHQVYRIWQIKKLSKKAPAGDKPTAGAATAPKQGLVVRLLVKFRPYIFSLPFGTRALLVGALTALLPCGWLYLFAMFAAATSSPQQGALVMVAFWAGTLPALTALVLGIQRLSAKSRKLLPFVTAVLLVCAGGFTFAGRGFSDVENSFQNMTEKLRQEQEALAETEDTELSEQLISITQEAKLPCCSQH